MSWRTWLGEGHDDHFDFCLSDYPDMAALCADAAWKQEAKVCAPSVELLEQFLQTMEANHNMDIDEFWPYIPSDVEGEKWKWYERPTA